MYDFLKCKKEQTSEIMGKTDASLFKLKEEMKSQIKNEIENMGDTLGFVAFWSIHEYFTCITDAA